MEGLMVEANRIIQNDYRLNFEYPSKTSIDKIKRLHRDMPESEKIALENDLEGMMRLLKRINDGDIDPEHLPKNIKSALKSMLRK
jgi:superfamily I DNA and RNA helicase